MLPLIGVTASGLGDWLSYVVYFAVAFLIFIRSDLALVNPTLYLYGWRVYGARVAPAGPPSLVICRDRRQLEDAVMCVNLSGCFLVLDEADNS